MSTRQFLVIGGTGMLMPFCQGIPAKQLILAARFRANTANLSTLSEEVQRVHLDYSDEQSKRAFLSNIPHWQNLRCCVLWIHSPTHEFSCRLIKAVSERDTPPHLVHLFGTQHHNETMVAQSAQRYGVPFTAVKLGRVDTANGWRWMTHAEISAAAAQAAEKALNH